MTGSRFAHLRDASFRGVPFETDSQDCSGGRRLARHEYPLRDVPFAEDLGRKAWEYPIEAFIVQGRKYDYVSARDRLRKALEDYGPGTLIHPSLGEMTVAVDGYRLKESSREGGYCTFSITFVEAGQAENPGASVNTAQAGAAAVSAASKASAANFLRRYLALPQWMESSVAAVQSGVATACLCLDLAGSVITSGVAVAESLILEPQRLADCLAELFPARILTGRSRRYDFSSAAPLFAQGVAGVSAMPDPSIPPGRSLAAEIMTQAVISAAEAAMLADYAAADDAVAMRDSVLAAIDTASEYAPDTVFGSLSDLRLATAVDLTTRGARLPSIGHVTLPVTQPALVAVYAIYGDAAKDGEIIRRNRIRHPGRTPGGIPLEVLR